MTSSSPLGHIALRGTPLQVLGEQAVLAVGEVVLQPVVEDAAVEIPGGALGVAERRNREAGAVPRKVELVRVGSRGVVSLDA